MGYCSCQGAQTLPLTSIPGSAVPEASSCAYTTLPGTSADVSITNGLGPVTTDMADCLVSSRYAINGGDMTSVPGCFPQQVKATVQPGSSPVHVGTLTGTALYTSISSALESICPSVAQTTSAITCETGTVTIKHIDYVDPVDGTLAQGELDVQVRSSSYNVISLRDAMTQAAALTAQNSPNCSNCCDATYVVLGKRKRWGSAPLSSLPRRWLFSRRFRARSARYHRCGKRVVQAEYDNARKHTREDATVQRCWLCWCAILLALLADCGESRLHRLDRCRVGVQSRYGRPTSVRFHCRTN